MVEELKRIASRSGVDMENSKEADIKRDCVDVDTQCITSHICYRYSSMVMSDLIEALDYFAGKQGSKVLVRILAKSIPIQMMDALEIDPAMMKDMPESDMMKMLPEMIAKKGGPKMKIEKNEKDEYRFILNECHFLPYSKSKGFCNVTAGLMLGFAEFLSKKHMNIEEIQTIAHGGEICEFIAKNREL